MLFEALNGLAGTVPALDAIARFGAGPAQYLLLGSVAIIGLNDVRADWRRGVVFGLWALAAVSAAILLSGVLGSWVYEDRPFVSESDVHLLIQHGTDSSFPSLHAALSGSVAVAASLRWPRWTVILLGFAGLMGVFRVVVGVHYPDDIVAGWAIGAGVVLMAWKLLYASPPQTSP